MGHVLAYFDADGVMLTIDGDQEVASAAEEIAFRPGADWSEASVGTNGPGTALAERRAIEVFASEHYVSAWQPWSCAAAPVLATGDGRPVGLVDLTGHWEVQRRDALLAAKAIARAIHERLRASVSVREEVVRYAFRSAHESGDALVAVDACGRVLAANDAAARQRLLETGALPRDLRELVAGVLRASPRATGDADVRLTDPDGNVVSATPLRHEDATVGALVRVRRRLRSPAPRGPPARPAPPRATSSRSILGDSEPLRAAVELARTAARTPPVVLYGESGTGKELFAQAIHSASDRRGERFVAVNCGSIPAQLVEAELFGYESGTFTGARREGNPGRFEDANRGTLFLDEVSELPLQAQTALLRVLQEREVVRLGGSPAARGRPRHRRDEQAARGRDPRSAVPPRPLLPAERHPRLGRRRSATAATTSRRSRGASSRRPRSRWGGAASRSPRMRSRPPRAPVAGERARAPERAAARRGDGAPAEDRGARPAARAGAAVAGAGGPPRRPRAPRRGSPPRRRRSARRGSTPSATSSSPRSRRAAGTWCRRRGCSASRGRRSTGRCRPAGSPAAAPDRLAASRLILGHVSRWSAP